MSESQPTPPAPVQSAPLTDRVAGVSRLTISIVSEVVFIAALAIAWWTKDSSLPLLLGIAGTNATAVVNYWIGSSAGSSAKDATIAARPIAPTPLTQGPTAP